MGSGGNEELEARGGIEPPIEVLQTSALPLGDRALRGTGNKPPPRRGFQSLERETGFEPATSTLARSHSTAELLPLAASFYSTCRSLANSPHSQLPGSRELVPFLIVCQVRRS
jgi:hypothetical protein